MPEPIKEPGVFRAENRPAVPWKNGGGVTREVAAGPAGAGLDDFAWRVSLADIGQEGPFSPFAGTDRVITLLEGPAARLTVDGTPHTLAPGRPFRFPGDAATDCRLPGGPVRVLNVMTRRTAASAHVAVVHEDLSVAPRPGELVLVLALEGTVTFEGTGLALGRYDAAVCSGPGAGTVRVAGAAAVATVTAAT
ncbi:HutD family protein [Streptomyces sp. NPDC047017]|uniref:HutD/Ves family protein n=1 Tax=Streptomyces sp. NPDC047017 TaxID=3155024 RepID=UPI0033C878CD